MLLSSVAFPPGTPATASHMSSDAFTREMFILMQATVTQWQKLHKVGFYFGGIFWFTGLLMSRSTDWNSLMLALEIFFHISFNL